MNAIIHGLEALAVAGGVFFLAIFVIGWTQIAIQRHRYPVPANVRNVSVEELRRQLIELRIRQQLSQEKAA